MWNARSTAVWRGFYGKIWTTSRSFSSMTEATTTARGCATNGDDVTLMYVSSTKATRDSLLLAMRA